VTDSWGWLYAYYLLAKGFMWIELAFFVLAAVFVGLVFF
jgi:hypothetical protein